MSLNSTFCRFRDLSSLAAIGGWRTCLANARNVEDEPKADCVSRPGASLALHCDHDAARRCLPLGDQRPIARVVVPILNRLLFREFDYDNAALALPFEHFMCTGLGEVTSAVPFDKWHGLLEVVGESRLVFDLVLA